MAQGQTPRGLTCPACGDGLAPPPPGAADVAVLTCKTCGESVRARRRAGRSGEFLAVPPPAPPVGGLDLVVRTAALRGLEWTWQSIDGAVTKAPLGGKPRGPIPRTVASAGRNGAC